MPIKKHVKELEKLFDKFAERLRSGWGKSHPLKGKDMESVRETVRRQWQEQKTKGQSQEKLKTHQPKKQSRPKQNRQQNKKSRDQGRSFGHSQ